MSIRNALPLIPLCPCTNNEWEKLHHIILSSDKDWDLTLLDCEGQLYDELWFYTQSLFPDGLDDKMLNEVGDYIFRSSKHQIFFSDAELFEDNNLDDVTQSFITCNNAATKTNEIEYDSLQPLFN